MKKHEQVCVSCYPNSWLLSSSDYPLSWPSIGLCTVSLSPNTWSTKSFMSIWHLMDILWNRYCHFSSPSLASEKLIDFFFYPLLVVRHICSCTLLVPVTKAERNIGWQTCYIIFLSWSSPFLFEIKNTCMPLYSEVILSLIYIIWF